MLAGQGNIPDDPEREKFPDATECERNANGGGELLAREAEGTVCIIVIQ